jgi:hypothetical protein
MRRVDIARRFASRDAARRRPCRGLPCRPPGRHFSSRSKRWRVRVPHRRRRPLAVCAPTQQWHTDLEARIRQRARRTGRAASLIEQLERGEIRHTKEAFGGGHWDRWLARRRPYLEPGSWTDCPAHEKSSPAGHGRPGAISRTLDVTANVSVLAPTIYAMAKARAQPRGDWTDAEIAREEATTRERVARDRKSGPAENVRAAAALARFANRVADAAEAARRDGRARS